MKLEDYEIFSPTLPIDEKDFDINVWRKENPMDYVKAIKLIDLADDLVKESIFETIYSITQMYVPDILYKFYSLSQDNELNNKKLETLRNCKIFLSDVKSFNDPFDAKGYFYTPKEFEKYLRLEQDDKNLLIMSHHL